MRRKKPANRFSHETESRENEHEMPGGGMQENGAGAKSPTFAMGGESEEGVEEMPGSGMSGPKRASIIQGSASRRQIQVLDSGDIDAAAGRPSTWTISSPGIGDSVGRGSSA